MDLTSARSRGLLQDDDRFLLVDVERFQGPLDLLLHLIRQQDIDVFDIPIARITDQFLAAIAEIRAEDLDNAGEFLDMASTLVRIKAQMLLPRPEEDEEEDPRAELVRRLLEYEQIREISTRLASAEAERSRQLGKGYVEPRRRTDAEPPPLETTWDEVWERALEVELPHRGRDRRTHRIATRPVAMEQKSELILETLRRVSRIEFSRLVQPWSDGIHAVMTFLASLELGKQRRVTLRQVRPFAELWLYPHEDDGGDDGEGARDDAASGGGETGPAETSGGERAPDEERP